MFINEENSFSIVALFQNENKIGYHIYLFCLLTLIVSCIDIKTCSGPWRFSTCWNSYGSNSQVIDFLLLYFFWYFLWILIWSCNMCYGCHSEIIIWRGRTQSFVLVIFVCAFSFLFLSIDWCVPKFRCNTLLLFIWQRNWMSGIFCLPMCGCMGFSWYSFLWWTSILKKVLILEFSLLLQQGNNCFWKSFLMNADSKWVPSSKYKKNAWERSLNPGKEKCIGKKNTNNSYYVVEIKVQNIGSRGHIG